jgi:DNA repair protein RecN (Recombination protein N)
VLVELTVENFAVIERARLRLGPGMNVVTGETGAGKSLLVGALATVLGSRADRNVIRTGAKFSRVEAVFQVQPGSLPGLVRSLTENGLSQEQDGVIVLSREILKSGPNLCRVNGRTVALTVLREIGRHLVDIHGQNEHTALLSTSHQIEFLDSFGGLGQARADVMDVVHRLRRVRESILSLEQDTAKKDQKHQLLEYQTQEIERANLVPREDITLTQERNSLAHAESIQKACFEAHEGLYGGNSSAVDLISQVQAILKVTPDPEGKLAFQIESLASAKAMIEDTAREVRSYGATIEANPGRLILVDERLDFIQQLRRKYGTTLEGIISLGKQIRQELEEMENSAETIEQTYELLRNLNQEAGNISWELSQRRQDVSRQLETAMVSELRDLQMGRIQFSIFLGRIREPGGLPAPDGYEYTFYSDGIDRVEFLVTANPGEELRPLAKVASGGEMARFMLAIKASLQDNSGVPTLVFDEIDAGVGARAGEIVGAKLSGVGQHHQVICVTHLPQIAAYADHHFQVDKSVLFERTFADVQELEEADRLREIAALVGGSPTTKSIETARELLQRAFTYKANLTFTE